MLQKAPDFHTPVLGLEASKWLITDPEGLYVDATLGGGGHATEFLKKLRPGGRLIGIDRDAEAISFCRNRLQNYTTQITLIQAPFWNLLEILNNQRPSGIFFDLGVSSHQIDQPDRGFSYLQDGPLDMRMGPDVSLTAREIVNNYSQDQLTRIFRSYGQERASGRIARAICRQRLDLEFTRTGELAQLIQRVAPGRFAQKTLARIFQAIRIEVNSELAELKDSFENAIQALQPGGRIGILSYHSLEDQIVKQVFREAEKGCICPPDFPVCACGRQPMLVPRTPGGIRAEEVERKTNPRSRSATLRVAEKLTEEFE